MVLKRGGGRCPKGVICVSNSVIFIIIAILIGLLGLYFYNREVSREIPTDKIRYTEQKSQLMKSHLMNPTIINISQKGGDDRYTRAPEPLKPLNYLMNSSFNIPTQGYSDSFSSYGMFTTEDGQVLPLYGKRANGNRDRYNYYTRTDTYNPVQMPVKFNKRDCMDDNGCEEISTKDVITIPATGKEGTATIYKTDSLQYSG